MPPVPRPRSAHLLNNEENANEKCQSSIPPLSQSRARRLKEKTAANTNNEIPRTPPATPSSNSESSFIDRIRQNDTLVRYKRELSSPNQNNSTDGKIFSFKSIFTRLFQIPVRLVLKLQLVNVGVNYVFIRIPALKTRNSSHLLLQHQPRHPFTIVLYRMIVKSIQWNKNEKLSMI